MSESISSESEPSSKRKRPIGSHTDTAITDAITRSSLWFDDGSIVIEAERTQFRVHKGVISRHSSVFRDMFTIPQPEDVPAIAGCSIVHVTDRAEDWQNVLEVLYDGVKAYKCTQAVSLPLLGSMIRLGRKYQFDHLQTEAIERLRAELPRSLESWDKTFTLVGETILKTQLDYHIFDLLNLLLEFGIESMLPVAYYTCLDQYTLKEILCGTIREDNTPVDLAFKAKASLALGREALSQAITLSLGWLGENDLESCLNRATCKTMQFNLLKQVIEYWHSSMLFAPMTWKNWYSPSLTEFCTVCTDKMRRNCQSSRQQVWDALPTYFGLPGWDDLKDD